jgi:hypothetical protein
VTDLHATHGPVLARAAATCDHEWVPDTDGHGTYHCAECGATWLRPALRVVAP